MRTELLNIFLAIAETGSISQAARKHYISQPAVTTQLKVLESEVGHQLFVRNTGQRKALQLTEAGERLLPYAKKIVDLCQEMDSALCKLNTNFPELTLASGPNIGTYIVPYLTNAFRKTYPTVPVKINMVHGLTVHQKLLSHACDMIITSNLPKGFDYVAEVFYEDQLVLIAPDDYPIDDTITIHRLKKLPLAMREGDCTVNARLNAHFQKFGFTIGDLNAAMQVYGNEAVKQAVNAGGVLGFVAKSSISGFNADRPYRIIQVKRLTIERHIYLVRLASKPLSASMECFSKFAQSKRWLEGTAL